MSRKKVLTGAGVGFLALATVSAVAYVSATGIASSLTASSTGASDELSDQEPAGGLQGSDDESDISAAATAASAEYETFEATAYCDFGITYSGVRVRRGIVAADPEILPIGSVIEVRAGDYSGIYTVMDTGGVVKGQLIDIFMPDYEEAVQFGRQDVKVRVLRHGWHPDAAPTLQYTLAG